MEEDWKSKYLESGARNDESSAADVLLAEFIEHLKGEGWSVTGGLYTFAATHAETTRAVFFRRRGFASYICVFRSEVGSATSEASTPKTAFEQAESEALTGAIRDPRGP